MKKYILVTEKKWHDSLFHSLEKRSGEQWKRMLTQDDFSLDALNSFQPDIVFIPHWSYIISDQIFTRYECIVFHMTDLPYGRGGSPLQNLIVKGHKATQISAMRVSQGIDTGDVYQKKPLPLQGTAHDIFLRSTKIIETMINEIIIQKPTPKPQEGKPTLFKRRKREDGNLQELNELKLVLDYIRMLDCEGYPPAFLETENFTFEFTNANMQDDKIINANVRIFQK